MTIHLIFNAHIDPVWLWPWQAGLDEILATCRSACDRLDAHPDLRFTRGESWVYKQIERIDAPLFARIRAHIESGRWEIVGGWWLQPDCNLPGGTGMHKQIELGKNIFRKPSAFFRIPLTTSILSATPQRFRR
jgi:alpha-mannosidase